MQEVFVFIVILVDLGKERSTKPSKDKYFTLFTSLMWQMTSGKCSSKKTAVTSPQHQSCEAYAHKGVNSHRHIGDVRGCARALLLMLIHLWMQPHHQLGVSKPTQRCIRQAQPKNNPVWARLSTESMYGKEWPIDVPVPGTVLMPA